MAIFIDENSKVIVQGMTGSEGGKHTRRMIAAGTNVVGGTNPRKAGQKVDFDGASLPVFATVAEAMAETGADVTVVFVPPSFAKAAVIEAVDARIPLAVVITEGIPVHDTAAFWAYAQQRGDSTRIVGPNCPGVISPGKSNAGIIPADITEGIPVKDSAEFWAYAKSKGGATRIVGPNCPGVISPGKSNAGIIPATITGAGPIGLVSKSGTLTYQMMYELRDIGFSSCVGIGGDPVIGTTHIDCLAAFQEDPETDAIVMIGEIGGDAEERAAEYIKANVTKPVVGYVAGFTAPEGKTMGHAGAIVSGSSGTAAAKKDALEAAGVQVGKTPSETARLTRDLVRNTE